MPSSLAVERGVGRLGPWEVQGLVPDGCVEHRFDEVCQALRGREVPPGKLGKAGEAPFQLAWECDVVVSRGLCDSQVDCGVLQV